MNLTDNKEGKYLYKYVPFNQYSLQLLINSKFWLGAPDLLNDPFEGDFVIDNYKEFINELCVNILHNWNKRRKWSTRDNELIANEMINNESYFLSVLYDYLNFHYINNSYGTTSFSTECESLKMWSHYADSHKGFVIVFDYNILKTSIFDATISKVTYGELPKVKISITNNNITITDDAGLLFRKPPEWESEKEVRIVRKYLFESDLERLLKFQEESILGIICGSRMPFLHSDTIAALFKDRGIKIKLYYARKNKMRNIYFHEKDQE